MAPSPLVAQLPEHVRYERRELPIAENALVDWQKANQLVFVPAEDQMSRIHRLYYGDEETCQAVESSNSRSGVSTTSGSP